jgi:hypothetical protein
VAGLLGGRGPTGRQGSSWHEFAAYTAGFSCRQLSGGGARAGLPAGAGGVGPCLGAVTAWACTAGERGWPVTSGEPASRTRIPTVPATIAVNVGIDGPGREIPDVTGVGAEPAGHTLPRTQPMPFRRAAPQPTATAPPTDHARGPTRTADRRRGTTATSHKPARRTRIATLPSYIDGNVAQDVRAGDSCDVAVVAGTTGHTLPPYPAPAVPAPRHEPTATAPPTDHAGAPPGQPIGVGGTTATSHKPAPDSRIATLPSYIDGNVAQDVRAGISCDVTVVGAGTNRPRPPSPVPSPCRYGATHPSRLPRRRRPTTPGQRHTTRRPPRRARRCRPLSRTTSHERCPGRKRATLPSSTPSPPARKGAAPPADPDVVHARATTTSGSQGDSRGHARCAGESATLPCRHGGEATADVRARAHQRNRREPTARRPPTAPSGRPHRSLRKRLDLLHRHVGPGGAVGPDDRRLVAAGVEDGVAVARLLGG